MKNALIVLLLSFSSLSYALDQLELPPGPTDEYYKETSFLEIITLSEQYNIELDFELIQRNILYSEIKDLMFKKSMVAIKALSPQAEAAYMQKALQMQAEAYEHMQRAKNLSNSLYDFEMRDYVSAVIGATIASLRSGSPYNIALNTLLGTLGSIAPRIYERYMDMCAEIKKSEDCFKWYEFYADLAANG